MSNYIKENLDPDFVKELENIAREKVRLGTWKPKKRNSMPSIRRLTKGIPKLSYWGSRIKKDLIETPMEDDING